VGFTAVMTGLVAFGGDPAPDTDRTEIAVRGGALDLDVGRP
jgi:hypothetical protein